MASVPHQFHCGACFERFNSVGNPYESQLRSQICRAGTNQDQHIGPLFRNIFLNFSEYVIYSTEQKIWVTVAFLAQLFAAVYIYGFQYGTTAVSITAVIIGWACALMSTLAKRSVFYRKFRFIWAPLSQILFTPRYNPDCMGPVSFCEACSCEFDLENNIYQVGAAVCSHRLHTGRIITINPHPMVAAYKASSQESFGLSFAAVLVQCVISYLPSQLHEITRVFYILSVALSFCSVLLGFCPGVCPPGWDILAYLLEEEDDIYEDLTTILPHNTPSPLHNELEMV